MDPKTWTIAGTTITQDANGRIRWTSKAAVEVDDANGQNAKRWDYRFDNKGLDLLANVGWPNKSWRNVLIDDGAGQPHTDEHGTTQLLISHRKSDISDGVTFEFWPG